VKDEKLTKVEGLRTGMTTRKDSRGSAGFGGRHLDYRSMT